MQDTINAAFIVLAVNSHDQLIAALKAISTHWANQYDHPNMEAPMYQDRLMLFSELRLSYHNANGLFHQANYFTAMRHTLEQMAEGARSNADFAAWAQRALADEKADRPKVRRRSKPLVGLEGMP